MQNPILTIQIIPNKGRGVVATQAIAANITIERAPVAAFPATERATIDKTQIAPYYFVQPAAYQQSKQIDGYFVFGLASLCNHNDTPNAKIEWVADDVGLWSKLITVRDIAAGEEVTLYYTNLDEYSF